MKLCNGLIAGLLGICVLNSSPLLAKEHGETTAYTYGMNLNIAKVIRTEEPQPQVCEVVQVKMTYLSTQGTTETVSYLKLADVCVSNG
ncbi:MAG: DUF2790 domain-containing protein [Gammaproteobacteria bacterium]|nr:DUF2790 domain-containing protein [Gammaproteobacteria bacterium]MBU1490243.1 DUF2790 domain-containing protein [Gammaproteobacteria bacterium]MBU2065389.1 DUF2790 domain-containing protein [Gammaproteobacteria bacterium]MBU2139128.1 DUF2790 domain-containing protein [Gammaproteobacteria bacterium]MBU2215480.1 DUF2790 domain-containing protein [Gammaproteobacteria bacterium]